MEEQHKGGAYHAQEASQHLTEAYKHILKAAEENQAFQYKTSVRLGLLESAKTILSILQNRPLNKSNHIRT